MSGDDGDEEKMNKVLNMYQMSETRNMMMVKLSNMFEVNGQAAEKSCGKGEGCLRDCTTCLRGCT